MHKNKAALVSVLAVTALSAVAVPSSLAAHEFKVNGTVVGATPFEVQGVTQDGYSETTIAGLAAYVECRSGNTAIAAGANQIEKEGKSKGKGEISNCEVSEIKGGVLVAEPECKVSEPIVGEATNLLTGLGEGVSTGSGAEETFATISIPKAAACPFASVSALTLKVKGSQVCTSPEASVEEVVHEVFCTPGGSKLKAGAEVMRVWSTGLVKLVKAEKWSST